MVVVLTRPILCGVLARPILADIESGTRENEVITPWSQIPNLIQLVQGTEQALPLYDPVHGSGPGEIVFRHMSVVQRGVQSRATIAEKMLSGSPWQGYPSSFGSKNEATLASNG